MIHVFQDCELDEARFELRRKGTVVKVEPKTFDVLKYLVTSTDRVVSKDELLDAVWPGQTVSESVLPKCVTAARRAVGDERHEVIATVHGRGYRLIAPVVERTPEADPLAQEAQAPSFATPFVGRERALERLALGLDTAEA